MTTRKTRYMLRAKRRSLGLSQQEMATLLGLESATHVSRLEQGTRDPSFDVAFAYAALFAAPLCDLFPHTTAQAKAGLWNRAEGLRAKIAHLAPRKNSPECTFPPALTHHHATV